MRSRFACPDCGAVPRLDDDLPPPRKIKCRKCGSVYPLPGDDEDEGDGDRAARRPRRRRESETGSGALVVVLVAVGAGVLLLVGVAVAAVALWRQGGPTNNAPVAQAPNPPPNFAPPMPPPMPPRGGPPPVVGQPPVGQPPVGQPPVAQPPAGGSGQTGIEVGRTAREIDGEDIDGKKFKLSDYRGKVVLLDFWGNW